MNSPVPPKPDPRPDEWYTFLSSRSYLEMAGEARQEREDDVLQRMSTSPPEEPSLKNEAQPGRALRPRRKLSSQKEAGIEQMPERKGPDRPARKRGRPRLEMEKDAAAIQERRLQVRRAQRTYRLKKEATIQALKTRVAMLEQTLQNVSNILGPVQSDSLTARPDTGYLAETRQLILAEIDKTRATVEDGSPQTVHSPDSLSDIFGYQVSHTLKGDEGHKDHGPLPSPSRSHTPLLNRLLPTATIYTYSHQESNLSRRLQRFCLEHTYRWITDPRSEPMAMSRVFGLLTCIHDIPGLKRSYQRVIKSEIGSSLEFSKIPYYTLGGAGTHFPRRGQDGCLLYPENVRRPGRVLRRLSNILRHGGIRVLQEDWTTDLERDYWDRQDGKEEWTNRLRTLDLDGEWFDCHDVQGYLEHRGVALNDSSLKLDLSLATVEDLFGSSSGKSAFRFYASPPVYEAEAWGSTPSAYVLDVECFFELLLNNLRMLGRAPGFRASDVDAALRAAIQKRPS
ncbi:hypothetical protein N7510_010038 [Penicillium lagena]|uniref:uncharacterized protein n=1 Tax=Penicillium lagena TaxID=94218 RepID=UPI002540015D|nr:uncharacterized protein N7510_010038 [Penicillium lagena]KAJ5604884.1 hypothetical protein N7510_010038 [Penicillium lagena]